MSKSIKATKSTSAGVGAPAASAAPEADFNDTIAHNRGLGLLDASAVPVPPKGYRPTDPETRRLRFRRLAGELRAEALESLREAGARDLTEELGRFAPDPQRAVALTSRLTQTGDLVARAQALVDYAKEVDQIALTDVLVFLELTKEQYDNAVKHDASLAAHYRALVKLFNARSGAIAEGIARAKGADATPVDGPTPAAGA